mgnify:CR=1 FL=1
MSYFTASLSQYENPKFHLYSNDVGHLNKQNPETWKPPNPSSRFYSQELPLKLKYDNLQFSNPQTELPENSFSVKIPLLNIDTKPPHFQNKYHYDLNISYLHVNSFSRL